MTTTWQERWWRQCDTCDVVTTCRTCGGSGRVADPSTAYLPAGHPATDDVTCPTCDGA